MNIINSIPAARARQSVSQQRKELWSWNKNQNVTLEQMKAATMVLNILDYAMVYIPSFFKINKFTSPYACPNPKCYDS